tara:strand:- start:1968 stop:2195 length:228 start_codon:yes stop_codon:yes gene_type:complete
MSEDHVTLEIVRETLDESIMDLSLAYEILKRLEGMGIITIRDFRDYEFSKDEIQSILNTQKHLKLIFWERDWNNI